MRYNIARKTLCLAPNSTCCLRECFLSSSCRQNWLAFATPTMFLLSHLLSYGIFTHAFYQSFVFYKNACWMYFALEYAKYFISFHFTCFCCWLQSCIGMAGNIPIVCCYRSIVCCYWSIVWCLYDAVSRNCISLGYRSSHVDNDYWTLWCRLEA